MKTRPDRGVALWLFAVAFASLIQTSLGGVTRLTDSGLSITEWKLILGVLPPLDDAGWQEAFRKYQQIPQYSRINAHLDLAGFQFIYFWEWIHRLWGRLLGFYFTIPLIVFWRQGRLADRKPAMLGLLVLGGAQGALGWFMVMSGLSELVYVSHLRLAAHFLLAMVLIVALLREGVRFLAPAELPSDAAGPRTWARALLALLGLQLFFGALMAGLKAALYAPTWPSINGSHFPGEHFQALQSLWNDPLAVHFVHRNLAYLLAALILGWAWKTRRLLPKWSALAVGLVLLQIALGIMTVLWCTDRPLLITFGAAHQFVAVLLLGALVVSERLLANGGPE